MLRIGAVAYAPYVVTIFEGLKRHFHRQGVELPVGPQRRRIEGRRDDRRGELDHAAILPRGAAVGSAGGRGAHGRNDAAGASNLLRERWTGRCRPWIHDGR